MRIYLEAREQGGEFHRLDVTDKTEEQRAIILAKLKDFMAGIDCAFTKHTCNHDTGSIPCTMEEV